MEFNGTFLVTIISFLVFVFLMNKILYAPMRKIVTERQIFIDENYSEAENNDKKANELVNEHENKIIEAKDDARTKYNELLNDFKSQQLEMVKSAQSQVEKELEEKYIELDSISNDAKEKLKGSMNDIANDIIEKVLGYRSEINGFDNEMVNEILYHQEG